MAIKDEHLKMTVTIAGDEARKQILDLTKAIEDSKSSIREMNKEREMLAKNQQTNSSRYTDLTKAIKAESTAISQNKEKIAELQKQMSVENMTMAELTNRAKQLSAALRQAAPGTDDFKRLQKELRATKGRLDELKGGASNVSGSLKGMTSSFTKALGVVGVAFAGVKKLISAISGGIRTIAGFEQANVNLATILGQNVNAIYELTQQAQELGKTTQYTASQVTGLQTELAKLGFSQKQILAMSKPVLDFSTAVGSELSEAAALAGATLRMFGLQADSTDDVLGTLAISTNKSALNFTYLQTAMSIVGPVAKTFGFTVKDTTALLGTLANSGFDASSAATATRNILLNLADSNGKLAQALGGPVKTFPELIAGLQSLNERGIDLATTLELTDKRSVAAFNAFLSGADSALELRTQLESTEGVLQDIASKRMNTVEGSIKALQSAWEGFILSMKDSQGVIKSTIDTLTEWVRAITPEDDKNSQEISKRTQSYVARIWNDKQYNGDISKALQKIDEDEKLFEQKLKNAEGSLEAASGLIAKNRAKKQVKYWAEAVAMISGARKELQDRVAWENSRNNSETQSAGSGGSDNPTDNPANKQQDDAHKSKSQWSLQNDESFLAAKLALMVQYNKQEIQTKEEFERKVAELEIASLTARIASGKESGTEKLKLETDLQNKIAKLREADQKKADEQIKKDAELAKEKAKLFKEESLALETAADKKIEAENQRYEAEKKMFEGHKKALEVVEKKHQRLLLQIQIDGKNEAFSKMQLQHDIERASIENSWNERIAAAKAGSGDVLKMQKQMALELAKNDFEYLSKLRDELKTITESKVFNGVNLNEDQLNAFQKQLEDIKKKIYEAGAVIKGNDYNFWGGTGGGSLFGVSQAQWEQLTAKIEGAKFQAEDLKTILGGIGGAAQDGLKIANQAITLTNANEKKALDDYKAAQDVKKKELEKRLKSGVISQQDYDEEVMKMDEEKAAKEAEMKDKQAKREKTMNITQAIINTALSVTSTLAQFGATPWGIAAAIIAAAMGAAEIAMISAQPAGYAEGGLVKTRRQQDGRPFEARLSPDKRGWVQSPTILVGEEGPEYVIPAEGVANPSLSPFLNTIEQARRHGTLRSLNMGAVYPASVAYGQAKGGVTISDGSPLLSSSGLSVASLGTSAGTLESLLGQIIAKMDNPVPAVVSMLGKGGIVEAQDNYERMRKAGRLGK